MTNFPIYPEKDTNLLQNPPDTIHDPVTYPDFGIPNDQAQPEVDVALLPGVPGQRGPSGPRGPAGPVGPTGPGVTDAQIIAVIPANVAYKHTQVAASNTWTITHNLHFFPNVTTFDSAGNMVEGSVTHTNNLTLTVAFSASITGMAILS
jgi:hypothetical protein